MVRVESDPFLTELTRLFEKNKGKGSVWVTFKRSNLRPKRKNNAPAPSNDDAMEVDEEFCCLVRATDGKKKISTTVTTKDYLKFQSAYFTILRAHMDSLKKKDKKKKKQNPTNDS